MSALDSNVALLVAALDLKLVQLIRGAMRVADLQGACDKQGLIPAATYEPRRHYQPTPVYEPRQHILLPPRFVPGPCIPVKPCVPVEPPAVCCPPAPEPSCPCPKSPFVPPWKVLPWEYPPQPALKVKLIKSKPDIVRKGALIDYFI